MKWENVHDNLYIKFCLHLTQKSDKYSFVLNFIVIKDKFKYLNKVNKCQHY